MRFHGILASDIDNTLTGDRTALEKLGGQLQRLREQKEIFLILSTGRRLYQVIDGFDSEAIPVPDAVISHVGTEIFLPPFTRDKNPLKKWEDFQLEKFSSTRAREFFRDIEGLEMQPPQFNTNLKVSCYLDNAPGPEAAAEEIRQRVENAEPGYQVVWSSTRDLDIIPAVAGKGKAIEFLLDFLDLSAEKVLVAGDSGNDRSMFDSFKRGIVVRNAQPELLAIREEPQFNEVYFAEHEHAAGVAEGLEHYGLLRQAQ